MECDLKVKRIGFICLFSLTVIYLISLILFGGCCKKIAIHEVTIPQEIENVIEVKSARNKIVETAAIGFGGGIGVGMGTAEIKCKTPKQFMELVPKDVKIFTCVEKINRYTVVKRYLSFIKHEAGIITYEKRINPPKPWKIGIMKEEYKDGHSFYCKIESFNSKKVIYKYYINSYAFIGNE